MRLTRVLFVFAIAMVSGCGGCDSCFGAAQPGDDAAASATSASPLRVPPEAGVSEAPDSSGPPDAAEYDASAGVPYLREGGGLPRPKAPMPMGAYSSCGTYDGPLCEKTCQGGACRQDCDGVECVLSCAGGYCSQLCGPTGKCKLSCAGGHCVQECASPNGCTKDCAGGDCK